MQIPIIQTAIRNEQDIILVRQRCKLLASLSGLSEADQTRFVTAVSEIIRQGTVSSPYCNVRFSLQMERAGDYLQADILGLPVMIHGGEINPFLTAKRIVDIFDLEETANGTRVTVGKLLPVPKKSRDGTIVRGWLDELERQSPSSAVEELSNQNRQLLVALEEAHAFRVELEEKSSLLERTAKELLLANNVKGEFVANISHEIRTPMTAIVGLTRTLERTGLNQEQAHMVSLLREAGKSLLNLINDILDLSKIESGKMVVHRVPFNVADLFRSTTDLLRSQASDKMLQVELHLNDDLSQHVIGDEQRIRQVLLNLLSNAIKFSDSGWVRVTAGVESLGENQLALFAAVEDEGPGIKPEDTPKLFQPFVQLDATTSRRHGGTGLGLTICKHLIELMEGEIGVESHFGEGSKFWFRVPVSRSEVELAQETRGTIYDAGAVMAAPGAHILIVEDHPINRFVAEIELRDMGYIVESATTGVEAVKAFRKGTFSLILMDCQMPEMDGFEATRSIRSLEDARHVPIVAMTASAMEGDRERCLAAGMDDYLVKPFETFELRDMLGKWLSPGDVSQKKPASVVPEKAMGDITGSGVNLQSLITRLKPDNARILLDAFIDDADGALKALRHSIRSAQYDEVIRSAHRLKGASAMVFAVRFKHICEAVEQSAREKDEQSLTTHLNDLEANLEVIREDLARMSTLI